jgi:hypothetical protein
MIASLARVWYGGRLEETWEPAPPAAKQQMLTDHGLVGAFWRL